MKILIACGGTAGHIFPGLALAEELRKEDKGCQIVIVVSTHPRDKEYLKTAGPFKDIYLGAVCSSPLPYKISLKYIPFALKLFLACLQSAYIMLRYRPEVVIGFGGYASFAPLIIARIIGTPLLIHEQNLVPGRANRLLSRIADRIAITFDDTDKFFPQWGSNLKIVKTGLPLRKHILDYNGDSLGITRDPAKTTVLVVGGSQGAHNINELVLNCLSQMDEEDLRRMHLIHQTGKSDFHYVKARYETLAVSSRVFDFLEDMASVYRIADFLIARSGASTIFEAATFGLPCVLIPYSCGTRHQEENALFLERKGCACVLNEKTSSYEDLEKIILELMHNKGLRENLSQRIKLLKKSQATYNLKEQINTLYRERYVCK